MHMNPMKRILCLLLALVLTVSMIPMFAAADDTATESTEKKETETTEEKTATVTIKVVVSSKTLYTYKVKVGSKSVTLSDKKYITYKDKTYKYSVYTVSGKKTHTVTIPAYDGTDAWKTKWEKTISVIYTAHTHSYKPGYNRIYHWSICECGDTTDEVRHVDPAEDDDKICTCGYKFNDNAELTTLWLANMQLSPQFNKETTEYTAQIYTYMDVTSTSITARSFDAMSTIQLPENLEIHEGANKFEIVVTAEDKTATKTYTVIAVKPVKVEDVLIGSDGTTISAAPKAAVKQQAAYVTLSEAVLAKMLEMAASDGCSRIAVQPDFNKWSVQQAELSFSAAQLKAIAEEAKADLVIETPYDSVLTIPAEEAASLAAAYETVIVRIAKAGAFSLQGDGKDLIPSDKITLTLPEA